MVAANSWASTAACSGRGRPLASVLPSCAETNSWRMSCSRRRPGRLIDDAQHLTHLHIVAVLAIDPAQHAGRRRRHFEVDLVGLELDERVAGRDALPFLLQPARDARVDDRFPELGHYDIR